MSDANGFPPEVSDAEVDAAFAECEKNNRAAMLRKLFEPNYPSYIAEMEKSDIFRAIIAVLKHQTDFRRHPLTCGTDSNHKLLVPAILPENGNLVLMCRDCTYVQGYVPQIVIDGDWDSLPPEVLDAASGTGDDPPRQ